MAGQGPLLKSSWLRGGWHLARQLLVPQDLDDADETIWADWIFEGTIYIQGVLFTNLPVFPTGNISLSDQTLSGALYSNVGTFHQGQITTGSILQGTLFTVNPTFHTGVISQSAAGGFTGWGIPV